MNDLWRRLQSDAARQLQTEECGATFFISPHVVPEVYRCFRKADTGEVVVEFRYIDQGEPTNEVDVRDGVRFCVGKRSGRLFRILVGDSLVQQNPSKWFRPVVDAIKALPEQTNCVRDNYRVTREALTSGEVVPA